MLRVDLLRESTQENQKLSDIYQKMMMSMPKDRECCLLGSSPFPPQMVRFLQLTPYEWIKVNENVIAKECVIVFIFIWFAASSLYVTKPIWIMVMYNCHIAMFGILIILLLLLIRAANEKCCDWISEDYQEPTPQERTTNENDDHDADRRQRWSSWSLSQWWWKM